MSLNQNASKWDQVPVFIIQNKLRTAGMSRERYVELLSQV